VWNEVLAMERERLNDVTFADLAERMKQPIENMYYI
jgi:hypothetical protein